MQIDLHVVKERVDLEQVVRSYLGAPKVTKKGSHGWICPFHNDHNPSFFVTPDHRWWQCFGCGMSGDVIQFVQEMEGISFYEAVKKIVEGNDTIKKQEREVPTPVQQKVDFTAWRKEASLFTSWCANKALGDNEGHRHLNNRGIKDKTIKEWSLGWHEGRNGRGRHRDWGGVAVYLPRGVTIPRFVNGEVQHIKVRVFEDWESKPPKYLQVKAGRQSLFGVNKIRGKDLIVICEGELDAVLTYQEVGDLVDVVAIGPKSYFDVETRYLNRAKRWLLALDNDADDATQRWAEKFDRVERIHPPSGNDITDFYQAGGDLRAWIQGYWLAWLSGC